MLRSLLGLKFLILLLHFNITAQNIWFSEDFVGSKLNSVWIPISGDWEIENGRLKLKSENKPSLLGLNFLIPPKSKYTVKLKFSGDNILILFNVYDIYSFRAGNYVKLLNNAVYTGIIEPTGEEKIKKFASFSQTTDKFRTISIEVASEKYTVYLNDKKVLEENLYFNSGFIILGADKGKAEIDYFIISSREKYRTIEDMKRVKEPLLDHINSIAVIDESKFAISSELYSQVQVLDTTGNVLNRFTYLRWAGGVMHFKDGLYICDVGKITIVYPDKTMSVAQFFVKYPNYIATDGERFYVIDDGAIKIFNRNFNLISSFSDPEKLKFPTAVSVDKYNIYCTDPELGQIVVYSKRDTVKFLRRIKDILIAPVDVKYDSTLNCLFVADLGLKGIAKVVGDKVEKIFKAENLGGLKFPRSLDLKSGLIFIADADKIVCVDTTLAERSARLVLRSK